jgi:hypothetical protein
MTSNIRIFTSVLRAVSKHRGRLGITWVRVWERNFCLIRGFSLMWLRLRLRKDILWCLRTCRELIIWYIRFILIVKANFDYLLNTLKIWNIILGWWFVGSSCIVADFIRVFKSVSDSYGLLLSSKVKLSCKSLRIRTNTAFWLWSPFFVVLFVVFIASALMLSSRLLILVLIVSLTKLLLVHFVKLLCALLNFTIVSEIS